MMPPLSRPFESVSYLPLWHYTGAYLKATVGAGSWGKVLPGDLTVGYIPQILHLLWSIDLTAA